jgi:dTMP kinase
MFVVFEGIDGSGKTTVSNLAAERLRAAGVTVEHLREGGKFTSAVTQNLREFGRDVRNLELTPFAEFFLYVTRDVQLLEEMTRPALGRAQVVIADRFLFSAEVLARHGRGLPEPVLRPVLDAAAQGLRPDLVVLVDVDPHIARARRRVAKLITQDRRPPSRKGLGGVGMQHRFRNGYREMAAADPGRWLVVDNNGDLAATVELVAQALLRAARDGVEPALAEARARLAAIPRPRPPVVPDPAAALTRFLGLIDQRMVAEPNTAAYLLSGLFGAAVDDRRRTLLPTAAETLLAGLTGLTDPVSYEIRAELSDRLPSRVARTLGGQAQPHPRSAQLRAELASRVPDDVLLALDGVDDDEAWSLRDRRQGENLPAVVASLGGIGSERAWALRDRWLEGTGGEAGLAMFENARILGRSISGLDDDRSWKLRKAMREHAPTVAIGSLKYVLSDRSFKWRRRYLQRAPKPVFETLARIDDPRAWDMREQMAAMVKEAIDSMNELDGERAWQLRERFADVWSSTVVKSLGPLADSARGRTLVARQLARYPENLSLLKHTAAIALGCHVNPDAASD